MKYLKQFLIIMLISVIGEVLYYLLPLPIPASIYGMVLMFLGLVTGIIKLDSVRETGKFLIEIMPIMFIPAGVGLLTSWSTLQAILLPAVVITVVSLLLVMIITGKLSQWIMEREAKKNE